jgi:hypothetical protein
LQDACKAAALSWMGTASQYNFDTSRPYTDNRDKLQTTLDFVNMVRRRLLCNGAGGEVTDAVACTGPYVDSFICLLGSTAQRVCTVWYTHGGCHSRCPVGPGPAVALVLGARGLLARVVGATSYGVNNVRRRHVIVPP